MEKLLNYAPLLAEGASVTVSLAVLSLVLTTVLGLLGAWAKTARNVIARGVAQAYTTIVRGVPELVLILLIYFAGQRLLNQIGDSLGYDYLEISKFWAGVFAIGFIYGAYMTETFRGAYQSIPPGQADAARALGLRRPAMLWKVMLPQFVRFALPGYANVWMVLVKSTALVSVIGLEDLVGIADKAGKATREPFLFFVAVILVYLAITSASGVGLRRAEAWANKGHAA